MTESDSQTASSENTTTKPKELDGKKLLKLLGGVVLLGSAGALVAFLFFEVSLGKIFAYVAFTATMFIVAILGIRFELVQRTINSFSNLVLWFCIWVAISVAPLVVFRGLSEYLLASFPFWLQITTFVAWGLLLGYTLLLIATEGRRKRLFDKLEIFGGFAPVIYAINVLAIAVIFFATLTYFLASHGVLTLSGRAGQPLSAASVLDFYMWHFLEAVPLLKVNQTLRWQEPWTYESAWVGWILLLFKIVVIVPVIGAFLGYWNRRTAPPRS